MNDKAQRNWVKKGQAKVNQRVVPRYQIISEKEFPYLSQNKKLPKILHITPTVKKVMKARCYCKFSRRNSFIRYFNFFEDEKQEIFSEFCYFSWSQKQSNLRLVIECTPAKDKKNWKYVTSRSHNSIEYHMKKKNGSLLRVWKTIFLLYFGIKWVHGYWLNSKRHICKCRSISKMSYKSTVEGSKQNRNSDRFLEWVIKSTKSLLSDIYPDGLLGNIMVIQMRSLSCVHTVLLREARKALQV